MAPSPPSTPDAHSKGFERHPVPDDADTAARHLQTWKRLAPLGLLGVGFGASLLGHATLKKATSDRTWPWVVTGTLSLVVLNAGLSMFGDSVKHRTLYEIRRSEQKAS